MAEGKMSHEYIHGYYLEQLKGWLDAQKAQFQNEQEEDQAIIDSLTLTTNAYLTGRDILQNHRENFLRNQQRDLNIGELTSHDEGYGKTWDWDSPDGKGFKNFWDKSVNTIFGMQDKIKQLDYNNDGVTDEQDQIEFKKSQGSGPPVKFGVEDGNLDEEKNKSQHIVPDYDDGVSEEDLSDDNDYYQTSSDEAADSDDLTDNSETLYEESIEQDQNLKEQDRGINTMSILSDSGQLGINSAIAESTGTKDSIQNYEIDLNPNQWDEEYDPNEWMQDDDGNWKKIPEGERIGSIDDNEKSAALMATNNLQKEAGSFTQLLDDDLKNKDKLKNLISGLV